MTSRGWAQLAAAMLFVLAAAVRANAQVATAERIQQARWWPTSPNVSRSDVVGPAECASCHRANVASQQTTSMAQTASRADDAAVLRRHQRLAFRSGAVSYSIARTEQSTNFTVNHGSQTLSAPLAWAFGRGNVGQSYLFERDGRFHEARVSYYDSIDGLDFTPNRSMTEPPPTIQDAMGRPIAEAEARRCFGCHTTASTTTAGFAASRSIPGVTCEACHGPGRAHVSTMERGGDGNSCGRDDLQSANARRRRFGRSLRGLSRHVLGRAARRRARHRGASLTAVPAAEQPLLDRRSPVGVRVVPRSARTPRSRSQLLRFAVPGVPRTLRVECLVIDCQGLFGGDRAMRQLPHAQVRSGRDALLVHRSPHPQTCSALTRRFADKSAPTILRPHSPSPVLRNPGASCGAPRPNSPP